MNTKIAQQVFTVLKEMFPNGAALHEPHFSGRESSYVQECISTKWVSSVGKFVDRFESDLAAYTGAKKAVVVGNGTEALHTCLILSGLQPGDEVLIPALTFVATANAVIYCGATPHLVDSDEISLGVDPIKLETYLKKNTELKNGECINKNTGKRIKALVPMHTYGHPVDLDFIAQICRDFEIDLIEDAAESLGSTYKGKHTGNWGKLSALSFNGNKIITTGGGGAILTNNEKLAAHAKHLTTTAKIPHAWEYFHDHTAYNYRLPNLNAALGCAQLEQISSFLDKKRNLAQRYFKNFSTLSGVKIFAEPQYAKSNYWLNTLILNEENASERNAILTLCHDNKILVRPTWILMHKLPMYQNSPKMDLSTAESLEKRLISLPSSVFL